MMKQDISNARTIKGSQSWVTRLATAVFLLPLVGCAQVKPHADFARARQLFTRSTGLDDIYDPEQPLLTHEEIGTALADGLTLKETLRIALLNNRKLHAAFMSIGVVKADWVQSRLLSNPTLAFSIQFPDGGGSDNVQASLAQNIIDLWQIPARKNVAQAVLDETILRIAHHAASLAQETRSAYLSAIADRDLSRIAEENLALATQSHATVSAQREAGAASLLDENLARGQALSAELGVRRARLDAANGKRNVARIMSLSRNLDDMVLSDSMPVDTNILFPPETLIALARENRLDLKAMEQAARAQAVRLGLEEATLIPKVTIGPSFEREGDTILGPAMTMTLPLFDQNQAQIAKADFLLQQALKEYEGAFIRMAQDIRIGVDEAQTAHQSAIFYRDEVVPQAQRNLDFATVSYSSGQTNILTLIEAQRFLLEARRGFVAVKLEASIAAGRLERTVGLPLDELQTAEPTP